MTTSKTVTVCSRGSILAKTQTEWVISKLAEANPDTSFELMIIRTSGDVFSASHQTGTPLDKGMFTKEIEEALLNGSADIAIHSLKDLPTELPEGLKVGAIPVRENPCDAIIGPADILDTLKQKADTVTVGTSSIRRKAQLRAMFPGCKAVDIRGNVDTRMNKIAEGVVSSVVLAAAGLGRLGRTADITDILDPEQMVPAPAQGALAIEIRKDDPEIDAIVSKVNCKSTELCTRAERGFLHRLGSGCRAPVGALATLTEDTLSLKGRVISEDGQQIFDGNMSGTADDPEALGEQLAEKLLADGAGAILEEILKREMNA
jgi:hydroxymethylbilane synthase